VLLSGDAGVGKTRLLAALGEYVASQGALVLTGRCIDARDGGLPYLSRTRWARSPLVMTVSVPARRLLPTSRGTDLSSMM
jgi:ABC-type cobalamin transport system ATPase subunit